MTARINKRQQALLLAFLWYLAADLSSRSAARVSVCTFCALYAMVSICSPCSLTICATCWNSTFRSPTPCSMLRISSSRSMMSASWKSTSSCGARRSSSCCCCSSRSWAVSAEGEAPDSTSTAARAAETEAFCFSRACRCRSWKVDREDWNSRESFCWVSFWVG